MRPAYVRCAAAALIVVAACGEKPSVNAPNGMTSHGSITPSLAPSPISGDKIVLQDNFDSYASTSDLRGKYSRAGAISIVTGRNDVGHAVRFSYAAGQTYNLLEKTIAAAPDLFVSYWYRTSPGADPSNGGTNRWGMVMLLAERETGEHWQVSVARSSLLFGVDDSDMPNIYQNKLTTPRFGTTNDGTWHQLTMRLVDGPAGYALEWIDGTLVTDTRGLGYSHPASGVTMLRFPGELAADPSKPFTIDIDEVAVWAPGSNPPPDSIPTSPPPAPVAHVIVAPPTVTAVEGDSAQLSVTLQDSAGNTLSNRAVTWTSNNPAVATVSSAGMLHAVARGAVVITAISEGQIGTVAVTVSSVPVASVSVALNSPSLVAGTTTQATATVRDAQGNVLSGRTLTWQSSNPGVASVNASGLVTAIAPGTANIVATSEGQSGQAALTVSSVAVASVSVTLNASSLLPGNTTQATATLRDAQGNVLTGRSITWQSSNPNAATVSALGLVTAVAAGTANIIATSEGQSGSAPLTVSSAPVASVSVTLNSPSVIVGNTTQATATLRDAQGNVLTGRSIAWQSSNPNVATVSSSGLVTAVAAGTANVIATSEGQSGSASVTVSPVPVATVTVTLNSPSLRPGNTTQATATTRDAQGNVLSGRTVTWQSSNLSVATVSTAGLVTAVAAGSANIIATSEGRSGQATLTVIAPVATVTVSPATASLVAGTTTQLTATLRDAQGNVLTGRTITWQSSNPSAASVSSSGLVNGVGAGISTITATSESRSGTSAITVTAPSGGGSGEPVFNAATQKLVLQDNFDQYSNLTAALNAYPHQRGTENTELVTGRGGIGHAMRLKYGVGSAYDIVFGPESMLGSVGSWNGALPQKAGPYTHFFFTTWFRPSAGADPADRNDIGIKGFMFWHTANQRYQNSVSRLNQDGRTRGPRGANPDNSQSGFNIYKTPDGRAPLWSTYADGQWHRFTIEIYAGGDPSGHWGERYWVDGVLIYNDMDLHVGSGTLADHYDYQYPVTHWMVWGNFVDQPYASNPFTFDVDDWMAWTQ